MSPGEYLARMPGQKPDHEPGHDPSHDPNHLERLRSRTKTTPGAAAAFKSAGAPPRMSAPSPNLTTKPEARPARRFTPAPDGSGGLDRDLRKGAGWPHSS